MSHLQCPAFTALVECSERPSRNRRLTSLLRECAVHTSLTPSPP